MQAKKLKYYLISLFVASLFMSMFSQPTWAIAKTKALPIVGKVIYLDPGHGGPDGGAVSKNGLLEKDITLKIAQYLRDYLQESGAIVIMSREIDRDLADIQTKKLRKRKEQDLFRRVEMIKQNKIDVAISLHLNAFPQSKYAGAQTFYNPVHQENKRLATAIQREFIRHLQNTKRLPKQKNDTYLLKESPAPTVLVEAGFLSNPHEAHLLSTAHYQQKVAEAIYYGLVTYYQQAKE